MKIEHFLMERWQSTHEHGVEINLSDSGVHPMTPRELVTDESELAALLDTRLIYTQTNGTVELRERIAALYPGASLDELCVVNGGAEANFLAAWSFVAPGDEVVFMIPNYMQVNGIARSLGAKLIPWALRPDHESQRWVADVDELVELVTPRTKLIAICNPNNPTGARLDDTTLDRICRIAERNGTWILADEIYQGSDLDGEETSSMWDRTERIVITNSLSKAYGLPGLRLGWALGPAAVIEDFWARHDYTTIGPGALSDAMATLALEPDNRRRILSRTNALLTSNYDTVSRWLGEMDNVRHIRPQAGAMLYLNYSHEINSTKLAERMRTEQNVLLVPGDHFGMDRWLRIGFGGETAHIEEGLRRLSQVLATVDAAPV